MPLFKLSDNHYVNTDEVAEIKYNSGSGGVVALPAATEQGVQHSAVQGSPSLFVRLKSGDVIQVGGREATAAWKDFQRVHAGEVSSEPQT